MGRLSWPTLPTVPPAVACRVSTVVAAGAFLFGILGVAKPAIASSVRVLFFVSMYTVVRSEMIAAQQYRDLAERLDHPPEQKVVEEILENTDVEPSS